MNIYKEYLWKCFDFAGNAMDLLTCFSNEPHVFLLDSSQYDIAHGRYSFIGFDPFDLFTGVGAGSLAGLKKKFDTYAGNERSGAASSFLPLTAGAVGYIGYDYGLYQEAITLRPKDSLNLPDCFFGFYDLTLTVDHFSQKLYITSSGYPEKNTIMRKKRARNRLKSACDKIERYFNASVPSAPRAEKLCGDGLPGFTSNLSMEEYTAMVHKALGHIERGDIYQVNLSQKFHLDLKGHAFDLLAFYRALRQSSPSPFGGYFNGGHFHLISNSPERFLCLNNGVAQTRPMKGTRPRGKNTNEDQKMREEIIHSEKEQAELLMITDLGRNDLGRVCQYGSVHVKAMRTIEEYPYVYQATSTIEGKLRGDQNCFDLIRACFPGGSVTGCPKIRAMEVIDQLEPARRGIYTGSLGYINFTGNMDFNIMIRTLLAHDNKLVYQTGGGIVADSSPEDEYQETLVKARAVQECLKYGFVKERSSVDFPLLV